MPRFISILRRLTYVVGVHTPNWTAAGTTKQNDVYYKNWTCALCMRRRREEILNIVLDPTKRKKNKKLSKINGVKRSRDYNNNMSIERITRRHYCAPAVCARVYVCEAGMCFLFEYVLTYSRLSGSASLVSRNCCRTMSACTRIAIDTSMTLHNVHRFVSLTLFFSLSITI